MSVKINPHYFFTTPQFFLTDSGPLENHGSDQMMFIVKKKYTCLEYVPSIPASFLKLHYGPQCFAVPSSMPCVSMQCTRDM